MKKFHNYVALVTILTVGCGQTTSEWKGFSGNETGGGSLCFALSEPVGCSASNSEGFPDGPSSSSCLALSSSSYSNPDYREQLPESDWAVQDEDIISYWKAIEAASGMYTDSSIQSLASKHGLQVLPLTWEDTGRYKNSSVGPNISDMTIQVRAQDPRFGEDEFVVRAMPMIRFPNFSDITTDLGTSSFGLLVGNQKGDELKKVSLYDFLENPADYLFNPGSWIGDNKSLLADRDSQVLVSAQAALLPIPKGQKATFNPVLFNYQSYQGHPAVLTILATREGTSVTVVDNVRDAWSDGAIWGQRLFHNVHGEKASLTGQREGEFLEENPIVGEESNSARIDETLNMVLLIQVPLKYERYTPPTSGSSSGSSCDGAAMDSVSNSKVESDMDNAVIGHGEVEGEFTEIDGLAIERDPDFPVRVTVQFYKATETGQLTEEDMASIYQDIKRVYDDGESVGSLVTGGETGRVTEYDGLKIQPEGWWLDFWKRHEANTGESRQVASKKLIDILGGSYQSQPVSDFYLNRSLVNGE